MAKYWVILRSESLGGHSHREWMLTEPLDREAAQKVADLMTEHHPRAGPGRYVIEPEKEHARHCTCGDCTGGDANA